MMTPVRQRILQRTTATLSFLPVDSDGELSGADPGTVTVTITRADGTALYTNAATSGSAAAARTYALTATDTASLDVLTATWKVSGTTVAISEHEIVGAYAYRIAELRVAEPTLSDPSKYTNAALITDRAEVEAFFESQTNFAFVPRLTVATVVIGADRWVPALSLGAFGVWRMTAVRWVRVYSDDSNYTALTSTEISELDISSGQSIKRSSGWYGLRVNVGVEHGLPACPIDAKNAQIQYARFVANRNKSAVPARAETVSTPDGYTIGLRNFGTAEQPTGIKDIDEVLRRPEYDHRVKVYVG